MAPAPIRYLIKLITLLPILACKQLSKLIPRDQKKVVAGAWQGNLYSDNPKYFVEYLLANTDYDVTWIGKESVQPYLPSHKRFHYARMGSMKALKSLLCAKTWISCTGIGNDITSFPIDGGVTKINPWHGIGGKKGKHNTVWDPHSDLGRGLRGALERIYSYLISGSYEWLVIATPETAKVLIDGYPNIFTPRRVLPFGTPRNDYLVQNRDNKELQNMLKEKYSKIIGFDHRKTLVTYMPTWRGASGKIFCFYNLPIEEQKALRQLLDEHNAVLIEKHHIHTYELFPTPSQSDCSVVVQGSQIHLIDTQELLLSTDILITDYSSIFIDYGLLKRPIIHFAYDLAGFEKESAGVIEDFRKIAGGPIIENKSDLKAAIGKALSNRTFTPAPKHAAMTIYETGHACEQLLDFISSKRT